MAAISETLAGQISNMGDNFDTFFNNLGKYNKGPIVEFFRLFNEGMSAINEWMTTANMTAGDFAEIPLKRFRDAFDEAKKEVEQSGTFVKLNQIFIDLTGAINSVNEDIASNTTLIEAMTQMGDGESETVKDLKQQLEIYNAELEGYKEIRGDVNKVVEDYNIKLDDQKKKASAAAAAERQLMLEMLARQNAQNGRSANVRPSGFDLHNAGADNDGDAFMAAAFGKQMDKDRTESAKQNAEDRGEIWANEINHRALVEQIYYESSMDLARTYFEYRRSLIEEELSVLDASRQRELELVGNNGEAKDAINRKYAEKERQLRAKQARDQQAQAIFSLIVSQGPAIAKTISNLGYPAALPFIGLVLAQFALQKSNTRSAPLPQFAEGVYNLQGPGTSTSDSIPALLSRGENVTPADRNRKFGFMLKEIIENPALELWDIRNMIDQKLPTQYATVFVNAKGADSSELLSEMRANRIAIRNLKQVHVTIDKDGFEYSQVQGANKIRYANNRYKF